jgi:hypothetical protein
LWYYSHSQYFVFLQLLTLANPIKITITINTVIEYTDSKRIPKALKSDSGQDDGCSSESRCERRMTSMIIVDLCGIFSLPAPEDLDKPDSGRYQDFVKSNQKIIVGLK